MNIRAFKELKLNIRSSALGTQSINIMEIQNWEH